ncbi:MAG: hypothetical protein O3A00_16665 [Planctomycetota bacterium]|nr:hypothetical protein [Planctomycetota bacterium]
MSIHLLEIPNEAAELALWLEGHLRGTELHELVTECHALHRTQDSDAPELSQVLGSQASTVLDSGLQCLSFEQLAQLVQHSELLFDLQDLVMIHGGPHWHAEESAGSEKSEACWQRIQEALAPTKPLPPEPPSKRLLPKIVAAMALGLIVAVGYFATRPDPTPQVAWGWAKPGALDELDQLPAPEYLESLAKSAETWFKKRPNSKAALAKRITEFRIGCDALIQAKHSPLNPEDKAWLIERCTAWSGKLDEHVAALESGADVMKTREAVDETINKLMKAIRNRSQTVSVKALNRPRILGSSSRYAMIWESYWSERQRTSEPTVTFQSV